MATSPRWQLADLIDFESLMAADAACPDETLRTRDREIFRTRVAPRLGEAPARRAGLREWLEARREKEGESLPGESVRAGSDVIVTIAVLGGVLLGASVCAAVLQYHRGEPLSVWVFLGATLGPQFVLPMLLAVLWLLLRVRVWSRLLATVTGWLGSHLRRLPGERRQSVSLALAAVERRTDMYGAVASWPVLIATQIFAVAFNVGIIGALLAHVPTRELRFGWQTTLELDGEAVVRIVRTIATPWRWAPHAHPSAEQILATRFAPQQAVEMLDGPAARAWWPFLAYAVGCYGLLLRGLVLLFAVSRLRSALAALRFEHADANALWRRLTGPLIAAPEHERALEIPADAALPPARHNSGGACVLLIAEECEPADADLAAALERTFPFRASTAIRVKIDHREQDADQFARLAVAAPQAAAVVVAVPAERDPIVAIALFLREVVRIVAGREVIVWLTGADIAAERQRFWHDFAALQRLPVSVELSPTAS